MINIPNQLLTNWLLPVTKNRRTELLCNIGLDQEKKGISKKAIVKIFEQLYVSPLVKVKPIKKELQKKLLRRNEEFKEKDLFINSDIKVSECLRKNEYDTDTVEDMCLPVITSVMSLRDDDEDSINISLSEEDQCENKEETCENKEDTSYENKKNTERKLENKLKNEEVIKSSLTQTQVGTPNLTANEKLHLGGHEKEKGLDDIGKTSNIENHQVEVKNKHIASNQSMFCANDAKGKTDTLHYNSLLVEQNKQNKKQIMILKEVLRQRLESKNISLPLSNNCKSLDTTSNISESRQTLLPLIQKTGVEFSTASKEEDTGLDPSEMIDTVHMEVGQLEKSSLQLSTEGNHRTKNKLNRTNCINSNSQQHKNNTEIENPCKEFVSYTPNTPTNQINQRLPYKKRLADQSRETRQVSKRRRMSATDIVERSLSFKQLSDSSTITQLKQSSDKIYENQDYSLLSRSPTAIQTYRRYSLDSNSSMTEQHESQVLSDISLRVKSNTNNTTKHSVDQMSRDKGFTESISCVHKGVETEICPAEEIVKPTVIDNVQSYSFNDLERRLDLDNKSIDDSVKPPENQLLAVSRSTVPTHKAPVVSKCNAPANQAQIMSRCIALANQAPVVSTCTDLANQVLVVSACTAHANQAHAVKKFTDLANQAPAVPTSTATANESPAESISTAPVSRASSFPTCSTNQSPALPTCTVPENQTLAVSSCNNTANQSRTVLTRTDPVDKNLAGPTCTAPLNQVPAVPTPVCNVLTNYPSKQVLPQYQASVSVKYTSIPTAVSLFFNNLESNQSVNDVSIPPAIRSELLEFLKIKGRNITHIVDRDLLHLYMLCYVEFFDSNVSAKIYKSAEILHLAIADYNRKIERSKRALKLSSDTFKKEEEMRANNEYSEMLNLRGKKFSEIFNSILSHFKNCASSMTVTLYYRITLALMNIDRENIKYIYNIRGLILNLLNSAKPLRRVPPLFKLFQVPSEDFEHTYMFVKTCLVILHAVGFCQNGSEDVLKFANLDPTSLKIKNVLNINLNHHTLEKSAAVGYTSQWETGITKTYTNSNINPNNEMSTLKNNTNAVFVNSQNTGTTSESVRDQRQIQETLKLPQDQLLQLQNSHRDIAVQNYKFQSSISELINRQQTNMANSKLSHLIQNNDLQNRNKFIATQPIPPNPNILTTPTQQIHNNKFNQVATPNNDLQNISKTHPSQQTPHQQTYLHNTFNRQNVNQREAEKMSCSDPHTVRKSQEVEVNSQGDKSIFNIQDITANRQTKSSSDSRQDPSPNPKKNILFSNRRDWYSKHSKTCQGSRFHNQDHLN